jgi:O-antigen/teichoic acid export membrane protein
VFKRLFSSQLRINMVSGVAVTVVNSAVLAVAYPLYLHFLGYERYGTWLVLSTVLSFAQLGNLGIGPAVTKLVAEEYGRKNLEAVQQYVTSAVAILVVSGAIVVGLILLFRTPIVALFKLSPENANTVLWLLPYVGYLSVYVFVVNVLNAAVSGLGRMDLANFTQSAGMVAAVAIAAPLLYSGCGIVSLLIGNALSYVIVSIISLILIKRAAPVRFLHRRNLSAGNCKRLLSFGLGLSACSWMNMLLHPFNRLILSRYAGVSTIPIYEIAVTTTLRIRGLIDVSLKALIPAASHISAMKTEESRERIRAIGDKSLKIILLGGVPLYIVLLAAADPILRLWLRDDFTPSLPWAVRVMLFSTFLTIPGVPAYYLLIGLGRIRHVFFGHALQSLTNVVLITLAIAGDHRLTLNGLLYVFGFAMVLGAWYMVWQKRRALHHALPNVYPWADKKLEILICHHKAFAHNSR